MLLSIKYFSLLAIAGSATQFSSTEYDRDTSKHPKHDEMSFPTFELFARTNHAADGGPPPAYENPNCTIFQKSDYPGIDIQVNDSVDQCINYCRWLNKNDTDEATWNHAFCYGFNITNWVPSGNNDGIVIAIGNCHCGTDPILGFVANLIVEDVVPAIAEITCDVFFTVINAFVQGLETFLPGLGEVGSAAVQLATQVSQVILYSIEDKKKQQEAFQNWTSSNPTPSLNSEVCGRGHALTNIENGFDTANKIIDQIGLAALFKNIPKGLTWPPPWKKGGGLEEDIEAYLAKLGGKTPQQFLTRPRPTIPHLHSLAPSIFKSLKPHETQEPKGSGKPKQTSEPHEASSAPKSTERSVSSQAKSTQRSDSTSTKSQEPTQKTSSGNAKSTTSQSEKPISTEIPKNSETVSDRASHSEKSSSLHQSESTEKPTGSKESQSTKSPSPTSEKTKTVSTSTMHTSTSKAKQCSNRNSKRAGAKDDTTSENCVDDKHVTSYIVDKMVPKQVVHKIKCPAEFLQACAHYYSAIEFGRAESTFTCETSHRAEGRINAPKYTNDWEKSHKKKIWKAFTKASTDAEGKQIFTMNKSGNMRPEGPSCQRDEWPPSYFLPSDEKVRSNYKVWFQRIRWIPRKDNGGAGRLWRGFCSKNDGNIGNGLRIRKRLGLPDDDENEVDNSKSSDVTQALQERGKGGKQPFDPAKLESQDSYNTVPFSSNQIIVENSKGEEKPLEVKQNLVDLVGEPEVNKKTDSGTTYTTSKWAVATFSQAVFEWEWDFPAGEPSQKNNYYLAENKCWPSDIIPEDPGFVLLTSDPWYEKVQPDFPNAADFKNSYTKEPNEARLNSALKRRPDVDTKTLVKGFKYPDDFMKPKSDKPPKRDVTARNNSGQPPPRQQNSPQRGIGAAENVKERKVEWNTLQLVDERLLIHDATLNTTWPLTDQELEDIRIIHCSDRHCRRELDDIKNDEDNVILVPPPPPPTITAVNEAEPTDSVPIYIEPAMIRRSNLSPELPMATGFVEVK